MSSEMPSDSQQLADLWFDPVCPWTWITSRWLESVTETRPVTVRWHQMSLYLLNEGRELPPSYRETIDASLGIGRIMNAARARHGHEVLKPLYDAFGRRVFPGAMLDHSEAMAHAVNEIGLPSDLCAYATSDEYDPQLRASHAEGIGLVGEDVGSPVVAVNGVAFFGPVISPAPKGEAAGLLWDGCVLVAGAPGFFEMKRTRTVDAIFD